MTIVQSLTLPQKPKSMHKFTAIIISACLLLTGCDSKSVDEIGYGAIEEGVYRNDYFNLSIKVPENWAVQSQAAQQQLMETGTSLLSGEDENLKAAMKESQKQTINLFSFFKYEQGSPVAFNPSILSIAEKMSHMPGVKRGSDYHFHAKELLLAGQVNYEFPNEIFTQELSGVSFDVMPGQVTFGNRTVYQNYYATRIKDYVLLFILSYTSDAELEELNQILESIEFSE